jgi:hypothetical protein
MVAAGLNPSSRQAGEAAGAQKSPRMGRAVVTIDEQDLERQLLRRSVGTLTEETHRCADCGRTPLIGETAYRYPRGVTVCELCRPLRRTDPERSEPVRNGEHGLAVRIHRTGALSPPAALPQ